MTLIGRLRRLVRRAGFDVIRYNTRSSAVARREKLLARYGIDVILDVGANDGGYARTMRAEGYRGRIVSFEPLSTAFADLKAAARTDPAWDVVRTALGAAPGTATLHVAGNSESSSFLPMLPGHTDRYPQAAYVDDEEVAVTTLEAVFDHHVRPGESVLLKIDAQGYEYEVLEGAHGVLDAVAGIQLELSLVPLYEGEKPMADMVRYLERAGYVLMSVDPVIEDKATGQLLQMDGLFFRPTP